MPLGLTMGLLARRARQEGLLPRPASQRWVRPLSLEGSVLGPLVTSVCIAAVAAVAVVEAVNSSSTSLGALLFLPVLLAAWLLGRNQFLAVAGLAVAARLLGARFGGVDPGTVVAEAVMLIALALSARALAVGIVEWRNAEVKLSEQARRIELLVERDRIGAAVNEAVVKQLFAMTLRLEALAARAPDPEVQAGLRAAVGDLDALTARLRPLVFADPGDRHGATEQDR